MIFGDLGELMVNILCLGLPDGPGWCVGADRCLKRDLKSSESNFMSKTVLRDSYWDVDLIGAPIRDRDPEKNWKNTQKFTQFTQVSGIDKYIKNHQFFIILPQNWN